MDDEPQIDDDALGILVAPLGRAEFLDRYYEQAPLVCERGQPDRYAGLLTLDALDHFIAGADLREGMVDVTNANSPVSRDDYIQSDGRIDGVALAREYQRDSTLIFPQFHESMFELGEFCRSLEEIFSCHVQTNVYLTPGSGKGFRPHYDNHDVFVMQIAGTKAWRFYDTPVDMPYRGERFELGRHTAGPVSREFTLRAGDCAYLPRGLMHDAENVGEEPSLHITVGLITKTWADLLLEAVSEIALEERAFRRSLPAGFATRDYDREDARRRFAHLIELVSARASIENAFDLLADQFVRGRRANLSGVIASAHRPADPDDRYRRRRFVPWNTAEDDGALVLIGPGGDLRFAEGDGDALDRALSGTPFTAADLQCAGAGEMIRRLWAQGFLERC